MAENKEYTASHFIECLQELRSETELQKILRYFKSGEGEYGAGDQFIGVKMGQVFDLAKEYMAMELAEIEKLLESPIHEARTGAVSMMDFQARSKKTSSARKKELFELYIRRHDRINNWDLEIVLHLMSWEVIFSISLVIFSMNSLIPKICGNDEPPS